MRVLVLLLLGSAVGIAEESALPEGPPAGRYAETLAQSPFALATKVEAPAAAQESFAANWVLTGLSRMPDDRGTMQDFVTVRSRDQRLAFSLFGSEESTDQDAQGVSIAKVDRSPESRKSSVTLKKGSETAKIEFGQEVAPAPAVAAAPQPGQGMQGRPGFPPVGGNVPGRVNRPGLNVTRPQLPRPTAGPQSMGIQPNAAVPGGLPGTVNPATGEHRRVRVINSRP